MENRLVMMILGSVVGVIVVIPIGLIFGSPATGIAGAILTGIATYAVGDFMAWIRGRLK